MLSAITLPDTSQYTFTYAAQTGILTDVSLPTGGHVSFTYALDTYNAPQLTSVTFGGGTWNLTGVNLQSQNVAATTSLTAPPRFDVNTNSYLQDSTVFTPTPWGANGPRFPQTIQYYSGSNTLLRTESMTYSNFCLGSKTTTLNDTGQSSKVAFSYGSPVICSQPTQKQEWDYGATTPTRTTNITYIQDTPTISYNSQYHIYNRPTSVLVYAGDGTTGSPVVSTTYTYDEYSSSYCSIPTLTNIAGAVNHDDAGHSAAFAARGNLTSITRLVSSGNYVTSHNCYDTLGNVTQTVDEAGHPTNYDYTDNWADSACIAAGSITRAFASVITDAMGFRQKTTRASCTALKTAVADENDLQNGRAGTTFTFDWKSRPLCVNYADGGQSCNAYFGAAQPAYSTQTTLINSTTSLSSKTVFDGLARVQQTQVTSDPDGTDYVDTAYDALGRTFSVSNPYRSTSDATYGLTKNYYDALGRTVSVIDQDGSTVPTTYLGNCSTSIDEAGKSRKSCADGLGRLAQVFEDPAGLNYETDYGYDALDNLLTVTQKGGTANSSLWRNRTFAYDGLSRLLSATNPESGSINYGYDATGNLATKTAPKPNQTGTATVTTTYSYDALNRLISKSYSDGTTPRVTYAYDGNNLSCPAPIYTFGGEQYQLGLGRRTAMCDASGSKSWKYDAVGRVIAENDVLLGPVAPFSANVVTVNGTPMISTDTTYAYNLDGSLLEFFYPGGSGGIPNYEFYTAENAAGRVTSAGDKYNNVLSSATYTPHGALATGYIGRGGAYLGNKISNTYNSRLQPVQLSDTTYTGTPILNLTYNFNVGNGDNGNVVQVINGKDGNRTQNFTYDSLNRIQSAYTAGPSWGETYTIDAWGNLYSRSGVSGKNTYEPLNCASNTKNQLNTCYTYDAAGNLIQNGTTTYTYDAESRLIATNSGGGYVYDGDGQRVKKCASPCSTGTFYWRTLDGSTLAESDLGGNWTAAYGVIRGQTWSRVDLPANVVHYYFRDQLGSTTTITDTTGNIQKEADYYPYGGEIPVSGSDPNHYKFTGKERDAESGLDYFGARYDSSSLGRFMTPDPDQASGSDHPDDPQAWNGYSYADNNPLAYTDPDGRAYIICSVAASSDGKSLETSCGKISNSDFAHGGVAAQENGEVFDNGVMYHYDDNGRAILDGTYKWDGKPDPQLGKGNGAAIPGGLGPFDLLLGRGLFGGAAEGTAEGVAEKMTAAEASMKSELEAAGSTVERIPRVSGQKTADFFVDGVKTELKTVTGNSPTSVKNAIQKAAEQSDKNILIDARPSGISAEDALNQIHRAEGNIGGLSGRVTVLTKDGPVKF